MMAASTSSTRLCVADAHYDKGQTLAASFKREGPQACLSRTDKATHRISIESKAKELLFVFLVAQA